MEIALVEARVARDRGEVPVGAVAVSGEREIGRGRNRTEELQDPVAHAEILALRGAARALGSWRLLGVTLYSTLEPCAMCSGACVLARIERLVYGADDPKAGAVRSLHRLLEDRRLNHRVEVTVGVRGEECSARLSEFFRTKRG